MPRPPTRISALAHEILDVVVTLKPGESRYFPLPEGFFTSREVARVVSGQAGARLGRGTFSTTIKAVPGKLRFTYHGPLGD